LPGERDSEFERLAVVREAEAVAPDFGLAEPDALDLAELGLPDLAVGRFVAERVDPEDRVRLLVPLVVAISTHLFRSLVSFLPRLSDR
jgi:hypothetical protein